MTMIVVTTQASALSSKLADLQAAKGLRALAAFQDIRRSVAQHEPLAKVHASLTSKDALGRCWRRQGPPQLW
jgi:hypothetical protein|eukprot:COSAG02_NODE_156_length_33065_cov_17.208336_3_plen_72_part_00